MRSIAGISTSLQGEELKKMLRQQYRENRIKIRSLEDENKKLRQYVLCEFTVDIAKGRSHPKYFRSCV